MNPVVIIGGLFAFYLFLENRALRGIGTNLTGTGTPAPIVRPPAAVPAPATIGSQFTQEGLEAQGVSAGLSAIPVVGPALGAAFNALTGGLLQASQQRAKEAVNENSAVAAAVPGWDNAMAQVVQAYNSGQLTLQEVYALIQVPQVTDATVPSGRGSLWNNYWAEVGPQVQPGRNGCQSGNVTCPTNQSFCGGSYGAGCCVGYDDLMNASVYAMRAVKVADGNPGVPVTSKAFPTVFASKYGGVNRPGYTVTFTKPFLA